MYKVNPTDYKLKQSIVVYFLSAVHVPVSYLIIVRILFVGQCDLEKMAHYINEYKR